MCTVVLLRRPNQDWPVILAANRDELIERPWLPPARHWPDRPRVVAGIDQQAGGSWLGLNDFGIVAAVLNRRHSLGTQPEKRSRGELVLEALDHADADEAAEALGHIDANAYRAFNLVVADNHTAFWLRGRGGRDGPRVDVMALPDGISILTAYDVNDIEASDRARYYLSRFRAAEPPRPEADEWQAWQALMASHDREPETDPNGAMNVVTGWGYGTVSSSLIALPAPADPPRKPVWRFAPGPPDEAPYGLVTL